MNNLKRGYITPELTVHGSLEKITLGAANGKGPADLDANHAQPNSKCPSGSDGQQGCEVS